MRIPKELFFLLFCFSMLEARKRESLSKKNSNSEPNDRTFNRKKVFYRIEEKFTPLGREFTREVSPDFSTQLRSDNSHPTGTYGEDKYFECEFPFQSVGDTCFLGVCPPHTTEFQKWEEAREFCMEEYKGDLAVFQDANQYRSAVLYLEATDPSRTCSYWIGGNNLNPDGTFRWITGNNMPMGVPYWGTQGNVEEPSPDASQNYAVLKNINFFWTHNVANSDRNSLKTVPLCQKNATIYSSNSYGSHGGHQEGYHSSFTKDSGGSVSINIEPSEFTSTNTHEFTSDPVTNVNSTHDVVDAAPINIKIFPKTTIIKPKEQPHQHYQPVPHYQTYQPTHHLQPYNPSPHPYPPKPTYGSYNPSSKPHVHHKPSPHRGYDHPHSHHHHHRSRVESFKEYSIPTLKKIIANLSKYIEEKEKATANSVPSKDVTENLKHGKESTSKQRAPLHNYKKDPQRK